jgi:hypothetical protein
MVLEEKTKEKKSFFLIMSTYRGHKAMAWGGGDAAGEACQSVPTTLELAPHHCQDAGYRHPKKAA